MARKKERYVQFSKRMVLFVNVAVTVLTAAGMGLCTMRGYMEGVVSVLSSYISFATVCFAAYSGNSMVEKWLVRHFRMPLVEAKEEDEEETVDG